jgi:hypothetical protein
MDTVRDVNGGLPWDDADSVSSAESIVSEGIC